MEKLLPIGIQSFKKLIEGNYLYIDKTEIIHKLLISGSYYFLSRPRRFGKSLLISTLKEIFSGNKELFKGLWIYDKIGWKQSPVIHISFSDLNYKTQGLGKALEKALDIAASKHNINLSESDFSGKFIELIKKLGQKKKVVILIDEYDKPIIDYIDELQKAEINRKILKNFYEGVKDCDESINFFFVTGVSKFSKVSIFSDLNHLKDITITGTYCKMLGYTESELIKFFSKKIEILAEKFKVDITQIMETIKEKYNGYSWNGKDFVFNPFSILNLFSDFSFNNYWFATGTPTFLVKKIKEQKIQLEDFDKTTVPAPFFDKFELDDMDIFSLLFQTGYLTIKEIISLKRGSCRYVLSYPNNEVREAFLYNLFEQYSYRKISSAGEILWKIEEMLEKKDIEGFIDSLKPMFASIPYNIFEANLESYYHSIIYVALSLIGFDIDCEVQTNKGRIDAVITVEKYIYIIEFKMGEAETAIKQIREKEYYLPYVNDSREVILLGIGFDKKKKNIGDWLVEMI